MNSTRYAIDLTDNSLLAYKRMPLPSNGQEVDFVFYGEKGLIAIEIKRAAKIRNREFKGLKAFAKDYPIAVLYMFYGGDKKRTVGNIKLIPMTCAITSLPDILITAIAPEPSAVAIAHIVSELLIIKYYH